MVRVGSQDVAQLAGVSRSTVSRVFTPGAYVAEETRKRVERAAAVLGYRPNVIARSLTTRRTRLVGIVVGDLENPAQAELLHRVTTLLQDNGMACLLFIARYDEVDHLLRNLMSYQVDALVVASAVPTAAISLECTRAGQPLIVVNRAPPPEVSYAVRGDNQQGAELLADHLVAGGYRRFAFMAGLDAVPSSVEREQAFSLALARHGHTVVARESGDFTAAGAAKAMRAILSRADPPDAVFCANDTMAVAALDVARHEFGLRPGTDLGVCGYDNSPVAGLQGYDLTTVDQDIDAISAAVVETVIDAVSATPPVRLTRVVPPRLVARESTRRI